MSSVTDFYNALAEDYHLIYADWDRSRQRQSSALHRIIQGQVEKKASEISLLDCSCGIGDTDHRPGAHWIQRSRD